MRRSIQIVLLAVTGLLIAWQFHQHLAQSRELASAEAQAAAQRNELESRRAALAAAEETNAATLEAERRAGNETLLPLMRERAAATQAALDAAAKSQGMGNAVAKALDSDPSQAERDYQRNQTRANLDLFFKLTKLSPEKTGQYVDLEVEMKRRQDERMAGLSSGTLSVADAVSQRDQAYQEQQDQRRELLGPDGWATLQGIADGMRDGAAKSLTSAIQANMGDNPLTQEQSDRLQSVIKAEVAANTMDDTDLFRPVAEWTQMVTDHEQHVLQVASQFLTPAQQQLLQFLEGENLKQLLQQREQRIKALGIKQ
ncbi:MAG TPA: hypothetical protein VH597_12940 [Verrucomicrobiae bacterium]|jgi:hypothetical protein|nr:hypothetical protein [Verrucomicrobiae bacterium]